MHAWARLATVLVCLLGLSLPLFASTSASTSASTGDDCHAGFAAYVAAQPYIVNPAIDGRRATQIVAVFEDVTTAVRGATTWQIEIRSVSSGAIVAMRNGATLLMPRE